MFNPISVAHKEETFMDQLQIMWFCLSIPGPRVGYLYM